MKTLTRRNRSPLVGERTDQGEMRLPKKRMRWPCTRTGRWPRHVRRLLIFLFIFVLWTRWVGYGLKTNSDMKSVTISIGNTAALKMDFVRNAGGGDDNEIDVTLGPHSVSLTVNPRCKSPRIMLRLVGEALVAIPLRRDSSGYGYYSAKFVIPLEGRYANDAHWYGCDEATAHEFFSNTSQPLELIARNVSIDPNNEKVVSVPAVWINSNKLKADGGGDSATPFVWMSTKSSTNSGSNTILTATSSFGNSLVVKETTPVPQSFADLSNYEIVCFMGSESAAAIRDAFLSLRPHIAAHQRPFKFHYKNVTDLSDPDKHWSNEEAERFRKCKIVVVSLDQLETPLSQSQYKTQVRTFLGHLVKALNDTTFPIWVATVNTDAKPSSSMCHSPEESPLTGNHPCNEALRQIFRDDNLPDHVHLMDNTDLSDPMAGEHIKDVVAVIALRVFAIVGNQVEEWRKNHQKGVVNGLQRGDKLEPNKKLVRYEWK